MADVVLLEQPAEGVALLRINRPEARNALNLEVRKQLARHLTELGEDAATRAVVLTGNEKSFAAGADIKEMADKEAKRHNMSRRDFLATSSGMATAFLAMNQVYGTMFEVDEAEAKDMDAAGDRKARYKGQFIFDDQTHFIRDDFKEEGLLGLTKWAEGAGDRKSTRLNSSHMSESRMPSSA